MFSNRNIVFFYFIVLFLFHLVASAPEFRVLTPDFVCPKTNDSTKNSNQSYITIKASQDLEITWTVRWLPIAAPSQRFTIMLWRTIRELEKKLNGPQPEQFVYIIKDKELLSGVTYLFNVTGTTPQEGSVTKSFSIEYIVGNQKLMDIQDRDDMLSLQLLGGQKTYADLEFIIEAQITTCVHTQDYYFAWTISDTKSNTMNLPENGSRLVIPSYLLMPGQDYSINCQVNKLDGSFVTQTSLAIHVLYRVLEVYLSVDRLIISTGLNFTLGSYIVNKNYRDQYLKLEWKCFYKNEECDFFDNTNSSTIYFPMGIPTGGEYIIMLTVHVFEQSASANATIIASETNLPVIEIEPIVRTLNKDTIISISGNVNNLASSCVLAWYFTKDEYLISGETSDDMQNGIEVSEILSIFSMEEIFLNEIVDYTNETQSREVSATIRASSGRARLVANCSCSLNFNCNTEGVTYADVHFYLNDSPQVGEIMVSPEYGVALETLFRISTMAAFDKDEPLLYAFYCRFGSNDTFLLGSYNEHFAVQSYLPYTVDGTEVFLEVCDSLGACSKSATKTVHLQPSDGHTLPQLLQDIDAHIRRCELLQLQQVAISAIVSYNNCQSEQVSVLTRSLLKMLPDLRSHCHVSSGQYAQLTSRLADAGMETNSVTE